VIALPGNKSGKTLAAAVNEIKPEVIRKRAVAVGAFGIA
jgi:hypothetical protein